jgi:hypothetical protein
LFADLSSQEKKLLARLQVSFFSHKKACHTKSFCLRTMKNSQHPHKDKPHTQDKFQDTAISVEDEIIIIRGLNLCGTHGIIVTVLLQDCGVL